MLGVQTSDDLGVVEQHRIHAGIGSVAVVMIARIRRTGTILIVDEQAASLAGASHRPARTFHPPLESIVRFNQLPHGFVCCSGGF